MLGWLSNWESPMSVISPATNTIDWLTGVWSIIQADTSSSTTSNGNLGTGTGIVDVQVVAGTLAGISQNRVVEEGNIVARIAAARLKIEAAAKAKSQAALATSPPTIPKPVFPSSVTTDNNTKIDLAKHTITLSDGTVLDVRTGTKVNLTV
jgi:hypothetical protein